MTSDDFDSFVPPSPPLTDGAPLLRFGLTLFPTTIWRHIWTAPHIPISIFAQPVDWIMFSVLFLKEFDQKGQAIFPL